MPTLNLDATSSQAPSCHAVFLDSRLVETHGELTNVLVPGLGDDERAPARLLRDPVVVHLPVERVAVLLPAVSGKKKFAKGVKEVTRSRATLCMLLRVRRRNSSVKVQIRGTTILWEGGRVRNPVNM